MQESRLFKIVYHLLDKGRATASELAEKFEVSVRTIYRDIDALSGAGIPIYAEAGRNGGIYLMNDFVSSYTLETREVLRLLHREFVYVGDPVPELNEQEHAAFLMNIHKSILLSLEKRKLLTHSQRERCLVELEKQYSREQKSRRRA